MKTDEIVTDKQTGEFAIDIINHGIKQILHDALQYETLTCFKKNINSDDFK